MGRQRVPGSLMSRLRALDPGSTLSVDAEDYPPHSVRTMIQLIKASTPGREYATAYSDYTLTVIRLA